MKKRILSIALLVLATGVAQAQDAFDFKISDVAILQLKPVQKELGVTEGQRAKMNAAAQEFNRKVNTYTDQLRKAKTDPRTLKGPNPKILGYVAALKKSVLSQLTAGQLRRLRELTLQNLGVGAMIDPDVAKRVGITETQRKKLKTYFFAGKESSAKIERSAFDRARQPFVGRKPKTQKDADALRAEVDKAMQIEAGRIRPQIQEIGQSTLKKMIGTLNQAQLAKWTQLTGKPYKP